MLYMAAQSMVAMILLMELYWCFGEIPISAKRGHGGPMRIRQLILISDWRPATDGGLGVECP